MSSNLPAVSTKTLAAPALRESRGWFKVELFLLVILAVVQGVVVYCSSRLRADGNYGFDQWMFAYCGQVLLQGRMVYVDAWENKPPLIHMLNAVGLWLGEGNVAGIRVVDAVSSTAAVVLSYMTLRMLYPAAPSLLATILWSVTFHQLSDGGNGVTTYAMPFHFLAWWSFVRVASGRPWLLPALLSGLAAGSLALLKPNLVGANLVLSLAVLMLPSQFLPLSRRNRLVLVAIQGFAAVSFVGIVLLPVVWHGALMPMYEQVWLFPTRGLASSSFADRMAALTVGLKATGKLFWLAIPVGLLPLGLFGFLLVFRPIESAKGSAYMTRRVLASLAVVTLAFEFYLSTLSGRPWLHYFLCWLPPLALLTAELMHQTIDGGRTTIASLLQQPIRVSAVLTGALFSTLAMLLAFFRTATHLRAELHASDPYAGLAAAVAPYANSHCSVLNWGSVMRMNVVTQLQHAGPYANQEPLFIRDWTTPAMVEDFISTIKRDRPLIIDAASATCGVIPSLVSSERIARIPPPFTGFAQIGQTADIAARMEHFYRYVEANYRRVDSNPQEGWTLYEHIDYAPTKHFDTDPSRSGQLPNAFKGADLSIPFDRDANRSTQPTPINITPR